MIIMTVKHYLGRQVRTQTDKLTVWTSSHPSLVVSLVVKINLAKSVYTTGITKHTEQGFTYLRASLSAHHWVSPYSPVNLLLHNVKGVQQIKKSISSLLIVNLESIKAKVTKEK